METGIIKLNPGLMAGLATGAISVQVAPREILVLECLVAGTSFQNLGKIEQELQQDATLGVKREATNKHDEFAVALYYKEQKAGYLPREKNEVIARLMDAGKAFSAKVLHQEKEGNWLRVEVAVFLQD